MFLWARSSVGRAIALQAKGQEFESPRVHNFMNDHPKKLIIPILTAVTAIISLVIVYYFYSKKDAPKSEPATQTININTGHSNDAFDVKPYVLEIDWQRTAYGEGIVGKITNGELKGVAVRTKNNTDYYIIANNKEILLKEYGFTIKGK